MSTPLLRCAKRMFGMAATTASRRPRMSSRTSTNSRLLQQEPHLTGILAVGAAAFFIGIDRPGPAVEDQHCSSAVFDFDAICGQLGDASKRTGSDSANFGRAIGNGLWLDVVDHGERDLAHRCDVQ